MQFVRHGPDIPERLLQAHEDGRVVFFCGAGISYPAGLPGFGGLVEALQALVGEPPDWVESDLISKNQFDLAIGHYENRIVGGRRSVRQQLPVVLKANHELRHALTTHFALLVLGQSKNGVRLVTTNFDTLFEHAASHYGVSEFTVYPDPPVRLCWNGLVYLHGRMPKSPSEDELERLVLSDRDFGQAYLTQGWAARFMATLFRDFTLCFVGYSIDDPVLRYMTAAHALDNRGQEIFAFAPFTDNGVQEAAQAWRAKNVTPVLYDATQSHRLLHQSLHVWSSIYRDGVRGKERLVTRYARRNPKETSTHDDFVGRLLWALSDPGGLPARRFADLDPVPSLDWLEPLSEECYRHTDLGRFGVPPKAVHDDKLAFSLLRRPSPYPLAPRMSIVDAGVRGSLWDEVMQQLAYWLIRHLDDPALLLWLVKDYGELHDKFVLLLDNRLDYLAKLERDGNTAELARIRASASNAIPGPLMRTLWRLLLTGRVKSRVPNLDLYRWRSHFQRDGFTTTLRLELRELLVPRVLLREPFRWTIAGDENAQPERIKDLTEWEIVLCTDHVRSGLRDLSKDKHWNAALPELLSDFSMLLRDAFDLMRELGGAVDKHDLSYTYRPSISEHPQNVDFHDWTVLIDLTLDAWIATAAQSPARAALVAESWWHTPYPLFRRLAFFAAAQDKVISHCQALDWLLADDHWWLWSVETQREAMRLLVALAPQLDGAMLAELEQAILAGPPRAMFKADIAPERWSQIVDHKIWLRLAKIVETGAVLSAAGKEQLEALSAQYPEWELAVDQRDEFPLWTEDGSELRQFNATPHRRRDLIEWLRQHPSTDHFKEDDDWQQRCRDHFATTACALCGLAREGFWPTDRWLEALQAWSEKKLLKRSWRYLAPILNHAPDELLQSHGISWWLHAVAKVLETHETIFFALSKRILEFDYEIDTDAGEPVMRAINHRTGLVTEALLHWWFRKTPEDEQGLPDQLRPIFTTLCDTKVDKFRHGRVLLAMHVIALFRVDRDWTMQYLLPLFDWQHPKEEARAAWSGFLSALRLYRPLMEVLKPQFLDTARHYTALDKYAEQYASLLTFAALDPGDTFTDTELADAIRVLPPDGLHEAAQALVRTLESAGEQRADYWANRVVPYFHRIWPKSRQHASAMLSDALGRLCVAAQEAFPEAMKLLSAWLQPSEHHADFLAHQLYHAGLCSQFPEPALEFLEKIINQSDQYPPSDLKTCLVTIGNTMTGLKSDPRFIRLSDYLRKWGINI